VFAGSPPPALLPSPALFGLILYLELSLPPAALAPHLVSMHAMQATHVLLPPLDIKKFNKARAR
jgi:hypothetical protein